jgi:hypothetical protein
MLVTTRTIEHGRCFVPLREAVTVLHAISAWRPFPWLAHCFAWISFVATSNVTTVSRRGIISDVAAVAGSLRVQILVFQPWTSNYDPVDHMARHYWHRFLATRALDRPVLHLVSLPEKEVKRFLVSTFWQEHTGIEYFWQLIVLSEGA